jgi:hypothetical protein
MLLDKELILKLLQRIGDELDRSGLAGEIILTGGASMCLVHGARQATLDVDALFEPNTEIRHIVYKIAQDEGLPITWLNDAVKIFFKPNAPIDSFMKLKGLNISTVSPEYLLAMKIYASRQEEKDNADIIFLINKLGIVNKEQASEILFKYFPLPSVEPKSLVMLDEIFHIIKNEADMRHDNKHDEDSNKPKI